MARQDFITVVEDSRGQKFLALEGMVEIKTIFGDPAKLSISQAMMTTPFGQRLITTVWMFPYKKDKNTFEKAEYVGSTMLNPTDTFSYKQAVINALIDLGQSFLVRSAPKDSKRYVAFIRQYDYDNRRVDAAIARWARSEGRLLFNDDKGTIGDLDNSPRVKRLNCRLNDPAEEHNYLNRATPMFH